MIKDQALKESLAIVVRHLVMLLGASLGLTDLITPYVGDITAQLVGAILVAGPMVWAQIAQRFKRQKLVTALAEPRKISEATCESMVKDPYTSTPSVSTPKDQVPI